MDKLAAALGIDPVELRLLNALATGDSLITGQVLRGAAPVAEVIRTCAAAPIPAGGPESATELALPGGAGRAADRDRVRRGVGFAVGIKNLMYSGGFDDSSTARCRLEDGVATITCAAVEVGQGFVTLAQQITREVLGVDEVVLAPVRHDRHRARPGRPRPAARPGCPAGLSTQPAWPFVTACSPRSRSSHGVARDVLELVDGRVVSLDGHRLTFRSPKPPLARCSRRR